jgi:hypothetical protein
MKEHKRYEVTLVFTDIKALRCCLSVHEGNLSDVLVECYSLGDDQIIDYDCWDGNDFLRTLDANSIQENNQPTTQVMEEE